MRKPIRLLAAFVALLVFAPAWAAVGDAGISPRAAVSMLRDVARARAAAQAGSGDAGMSKVSMTVVANDAPICMEGVPPEVAAMLQEQSPGIYRVYPGSTTCVSLGVGFFAGYVADTADTVLIYTDNASSAALLCSTGALVGCTAGTPTGAFTDLWWNPAESGWGVSITHHASGVAFVAWYTYDAAGNPKWYVVSNCPMIGTSCTGTLFEMTGPPFGPTFDPARVVGRSVGSLTLSFERQDRGTMRYVVDGQAGSKTITRQPF